MSGAVFMETLRRHWRGMIGWGIGIALLALVQVVILSDVEAIEQMAQLMSALPPFILAMVGGGDAEFLATPEGYLAMRFFGIIVIVFGFYAVTAGLNVTANDEEQGITDIHMSLPITRVQLMMERTLAYALLLLGVIGFSFLGLIIGLATTPTIVIDMGKVISGTLNTIPASMAMLTFTVCAGALFRRRSMAITAATAFIAGSYFLDTMGRAAPGTAIDQLRALSFYSYYDGTNVIQHGLSVGNILILSVVTVALLVIGIVAYQRRDLGL